MMVMEKSLQAERLGIGDAPQQTITDDGDLSPSKAYKC